MAKVTAAPFSSALGFSEKLIKKESVSDRGVKNNLAVVEVVLIWKRSGADVGGELGQSEGEPLFEEEPVAEVVVDEEEVFFEFPRTA